MKHLALLSLCLLLIFTLAACGQPAESGEDSTSLPPLEGSSALPSDTDAPDTDAPDTVTAPAAETTSAPAVTTEAAPLFDTAWASNDFEALLPELPFRGWTTAKEGDNTYKMELGGLNTSPATNPDGSGQKDGADKDKLIAYLNSLPACGFTVEETGAGYQWKAADAKGNTAEFMCAEGYCWITIRKAG